MNNEATVLIMLGDSQFLAYSIIKPSGFHILAIMLYTFLGHNSYGNLVCRTFWELHFSLYKFLVTSTEIYCLSFVLFISEDDYLHEYIWLLWFFKFIYSIMFNLLLRLHLFIYHFYKVIISEFFPLASTSGPSLESEWLSLLGSIEIFWVF